MTLLPEVGYRAETPRAMSGSASNAFSSALSSGTLRLVLLPFRFFFCANGASGSPSSSDSLRVSRQSVSHDHYTYMLGSMSRSIASAASLSQFRSCLSFLSVWWAFSMSRARAMRSLSFGKKPLSIGRSGSSASEVIRSLPQERGPELTSTKRLHQRPLHPLLLRCTQLQCETRVLCSSRSTTSVDIGVRRARQVEVDDVFDIGNIETS